MNSLDKKLYEIFWPDVLFDVNGDVINSQEPQLHDVFLVVSKREDFNDNFSQDLEYIRFYPYHSWGKVDIPYNPTLPLLSQSDETKSAIISLFS